MDPDRELRDKLHELQSTDRKNSIDQVELEARVARLRVVDPSKYSGSPIAVCRSPDNRTDIEKTEALLAQLMEESDIDGHFDPPLPLNRGLSMDEELEERLHKLKGLDTKKRVEGSTLEKQEIDIDSEEETDKIVEKLLDEAKLPEIPDEDVEIPVPFCTRRPKAEENCDGDVLTWCVICNEDARLKCFGCDDDIYCLQCFREFHSDPDTKRHRSTSYQPTK